MKKLYVIAVGYDEDAILKTVFQSGSQKVCILSTKLKPDGFRSKSDERTQEVEAELVKKLESLVEVDVLRFNWGNYESMIEAIGGYVEKHMDWDITLNITFGSNRLTPILMLLAGMHGHKLEYTRCKELDPELLKRDWHTGFYRVESVPTLPLDARLSKKERAFLELVKDHESLIVQDYVARMKGEENNLRAEFNYYAGKLEQRGLVRVQEKAKRRIVSITEAGNLMLHVTW